MFSSYKNVLELLSLLKQHGIKRFVVSPGSRHIPIVISMEADSWFELYSVVDERSASFFAIGLIQKFEEPVGIICTSGTAAANYCSAISEAYYQELPLLVITADRAPYFLDQHEDQMIHQSSMFSNVAKYTTNLPIVTDSVSLWYCNRLINEALLELKHHGCGPVQINIPIVEHTDAFLSSSIPVSRKIIRHTLEDNDTIFQEMADYLKDKNIIIVCGEGFPIKGAKQEILNRFLDKFDAIVLADKMSNCHGDGVIENAFSVIGALSSADVKELAPDVVISIRSNYSFNPEFKGLMNRFASHKKVVNWFVSPSGKIIDPFKCLTKVFEMDEFTFFDRINGFATSRNERENIYKDIWTTIADAIDEPNVSFGHLYTVGQFLKRIPTGSVLHIANSNSVRMAQLYSFDKTVEVHCNRGTDGIDGSMSSMVGYASSSEKLVFLMIGDLSFFYDMNSLWNRHLGKNIRIIVNNNGGGAIMHMPKRPDFAAEHLPNFISAKHNASAKAWAEDRGFKYLKASNEAELSAVIDQFTDKDSEGPVLLEVFSDMLDDTQILKSYYSCVKRATIEDKLRSKAGIVKRKVYSILRLG